MLSYVYAMKRMPGLRIVVRVNLAKGRFRNISNYCLCVVCTMNPGMNPGESLSPRWRGSGR